jgi:NitT/TauT family transport system substrate-binding protein
MFRTGSEYRAAAIAGQPDRRNEMMHMKRLAALVLLLASFFIETGPVSAQSAAPLVVVRVGVVPAEFAAEIFYGLDKGFFRNHGLDVQLEFFSNGGAVAAAVASGALDAGISDTVSMISAHSHGFPFVYLAPGVISSNAAPLFAIIAPAASSIRTARDMNGKTFGINGINNISQVPTEFWIDRTGGDSKSIKWVELPFQETIPALAAGRIEVALLTEPFVTQAAQQGYRVIEMSKDTLAPVFLGGGWVTTRDWIAKNPVTASAFVAGMKETARWANANPDESAQILSKYSHIPLPVVQKTRRYLVTETFDATIMQPVVDACARYGLIPKSFPATELFYHS